MGKQHRTLLCNIIFVVSITLFYATICIPACEAATYEYTTPGTYSLTIPNDVASITVTSVGGGGGAAFYSNVDFGILCGGGGGAVIRDVQIKMNTNRAITIVVGQGGKGQQDSHWADGAAGGSSYVLYNGTQYALANGGGGGHSGDDYNDIPGAAGGPGATDGSDRGGSSYSDTIGKGGGDSTYSLDGKPGAVFINVNIPTTGITLNQTSLTLNAGSSSTLTATVSPSNATNKTVTWTTSNASVATVSGGKVTAVGPGTAIITATASGGQKATCTVTVRVPVTDISISKSTLALTVGATSTLTATVEPSNASNKSYSWGSSNSAVATVNSSGLVTAKANGTATITATTTDGGKKASCTVTVTTPTSGVSISPTTSTIIKGQTRQLTATVAPSSASNKSVSWSSSNDTVATVSSTGLVTAKSAGTADITVTTKNGNYKAVCKVTVRVPVTGVSLSKTELSLIKGNTEQLSATISPADASNKSISWTTTDKSVATVSSSGLITAIGGGTADIIVTTLDRSYSDKCRVTVTVPVTGVRFDDIATSVGTDTTTKLLYTIEPADASDKTVTWQSSNTAVAMIDADTGVITPFTPGGTEITVTTIDGNYSDTTFLIVTSSLDVLRLNIVTESGAYPNYGTIFLKTAANMVEYPGISVGSSGKVDALVPSAVQDYSLGISLLSTLVAGTPVPANTRNITSPLYMVEGDLNNDNIIDGTDYTILVQRMHYDSGISDYGLVGDLNYDGVVDGIDLLMFNSPVKHTGDQRFMQKGYDIGSSELYVMSDEALNMVPARSVIQTCQTEEGRYEVSLQAPSEPVNMLQIALEGDISETSAAAPEGFELIGAYAKDGKSVVAIGSSEKGGRIVPADVPIVTVKASETPSVIYGEHDTVMQRADEYGIENIPLEMSEDAGGAVSYSDSGGSGCNMGLGVFALLTAVPLFFTRKR